MIPKKIHYCWFGNGKKTRLSKRCINSWKKYFPEYEIIEWNEENFDLSMNSYVEYMYRNKKYAYLSDYVRLWVIYNYGGIYFDLDVEVIKSFEDILAKGAFVGFESDIHVNTGIGFGAEAGNKIVKAMLDKYDNIPLQKFQNPINCPILNTEALIEQGFYLNGGYVETGDMIVYTKEFFNPYDNNTRSFKYKTQNTHSIHWYAKSWMSPKRVIISNIAAPFHRIFGDECFSKIKKKFGI